MNYSVDVTDKFSDFAENFANKYVDKYQDQSDDPINDFVRILFLIAKNEVDTKFNGEHSPAFPERVGSGYINYLNYICEFACDVYPKFSRNEWHCLLHRVFSKKYGGQAIYLKKNPSSSIKHAAKNLNPNELIKEYGVSRSYAYKLRKLALKKK